MREAAQRGLLASTLMFYLLIVLIAVCSLAFLSENKPIAIAVTVVFVLGIIALVFNHLIFGAVHSQVGLLLSWVRRKYPLIYKYH